LTGEAYFEIATDASHPFTVQTDDQRVQVLGTHFNVNAYHDAGGSRTTLLEGSVQATSGRSTRRIRPGQQVVTDGRDQLTIKKVDTEQAVAWKNDQFMFNSLPLKELMSSLARWYDVEIVYAAELPAVRFNGSVSKFDDISVVLKILGSTGKARFKIAGKKVYVTR
jgi:ferric-dicitrate binding protein FerR (iron transport regulator)